MGYLSELKLPLLGETMESGRIIQWCVGPGEEFSRGQILLEVETDKTIVEVPALQQGKLIEIIVAVDSQVTVGTDIARIMLPGTAPSPANSPHQSDATAAVLEKTTIAASHSSAEASEQSVPDFTQQQSADAVKSARPLERLFVTPRARRTASYLSLIHI